jgi:prepilin-type N-terminal cleavage/methylation domain-containing protein
MCAVRGFTLLELLVVIGVIAILTAVLVPRIAGNADVNQLDLESERVHRVLNAMCERAELEARPLGFALWQNGYSVLQPVEDQKTDSNGQVSRRTIWLEMKSAPLFARYEVPHALKFALRFPEQRQTAIELEEDEPRVPQIVCLNAAQLPVIEVQLAINQHQRWVRTAPANLESLQPRAFALIRERPN